MNVAYPTVQRTDLFKTRPIFVLSCIALLVVFLLPNALKAHRTAQWVIFVAASAAILFGWFFHTIHPKPGSKSRQFIALLTSLYLTASIPAFFFEFSQVRWLMRGPHWASIYVRPWVHWGFLLVYLGVVGAFFGRGYARTAFLTGSILLAVLWQSMSVWIF